MSEPRRDSLRIRRGCGVLVFVVLMLLAVMASLNFYAYQRGYRLVRVRPTTTPVVKDMTIWLDDVEWFCLLQDKEWECEETGRTR